MLLKIPDGASRLKSLFKNHLETASTKGMVVYKNDPLPEVLNVRYSTLLWLENAVQLKSRSKFPRD